MMKERVQKVLQKLQGEHYNGRRTAKRTAALALALAMVGGMLVSPAQGTAAFAEDADGSESGANSYKTYCGLEEHKHTEECYTEKLICGYTEGQPEDPNATSWPDHEDGTRGGLDMDFSVDAEPDASTQLTDEYDVEPDADSTADSEVESSSSEATSSSATGHHHTDDCYKMVLPCGKKSIPTR